MKEPVSLTPNDNPGMLPVQEVLTREEAAAYLRIGEKSLRSLVTQGEIVCRFIGDRQVFSRRKLLDWVEAA